MDNQETTRESAPEMREQAEVLYPETGFLESVEQSSGVKVSACYQCKKCTNGCPMTFAMDIYPDQVIRLVQMGQRDKVLSCDTIWVCSSCETCTTRCPNEVDIARVMDYLKERSLEAGIKSPQAAITTLHQVFLNDIRKRGRVFEGGLVQTYMLKTGELWRKLKTLEITEDIALGWNMTRKGRMTLLPKGVRAKNEIREILK